MKIFYKSVVRVLPTQAIFEGMKCFKSEQDELFLFRPEENFKRFNKSSVRLAIPEIDQNIFFNGLKELLMIDSEWVQKIEMLYIDLLYLRQNHP